MKNKLVFCWTNILHKTVPKKLIGGGTFNSRVIVAGANICTDGKNQYFDHKHNKITKEEYEKIQKSI